MTEFSLLSLVYSAGLAQAAFLVIALAAKRVRHTDARWLIVAIIVIFSILLTEEFFDEIGVPLSLGLGLAVELALAPLIYLLARSMLRDLPPGMPRDLIHFCPLMVATIARLGLHIGSAGPVSASSPDIGALVAGIVLCKIVVFFIYGGAALRVPLPSNLAAPRRAALNGLRLVIAICVASYGLSALAFVAFMAGARPIPDPDIIGAIAVAASVYAVGYYGLVSDALDVGDPYGDQALDATQASEIRDRAVAYLRTSESFRDADLNLASLSRRIGVKPRVLTQALNSGEAGGFARLIGALRVEAYLIARADPANSSRSSLELAFDAGFNSKATFYRVLKSIGRSAPA